MPPPLDFRRRRRRRFALFQQPLIGFWLAALLVQAAAQPHAREDHAQHIMNQARANQKACGRQRQIIAVAASAVGRESYYAVNDVASMADASHRWRTGWRTPHRRRTKQQREWQRRKHEEGKRATKADNMKAQRQARKDLLKRKRDLAKRKKERDRRKRSVSSAFGEL